MWSAVTLFTLLIAACQPRAEATPPPLPPTAALSELEGTVLIRQPGQASFAEAKAGMTLLVKGQVQTAEDGRARLDLSTGTIVRVAPLTIFTLETNEQTGEGMLTRLKMEAGRLWVSLVGGSLEVETPSGLAVVRGSFLGIWIDPLTLNVWVSCFEGECAASTPSWALELGTGEGAVLYAFAPGETPPPPDFRQLTWQEFEEWAQTNPEAATVLPDIIASLTALPSPTPTLTATATETSTPASTLTPLPTPLQPTETPTSEPPSPTSSPPSSLTTGGLASTRITASGGEGWFAEFPVGRSSKGATASFAHVPITALNIPSSPETGYNLHLLSKARLDMSTTTGIHLVCSPITHLGSVIFWWEPSSHAWVPLANFRTYPAVSGQPYTCVNTWLTGTFGFGYIEP
jgi:hypothetical protein